jgi:hypothetical protein
MSERDVLFPRHQFILSNQKENEEEEARSGPCGVLSRRTGED